MSTERGTGTGTDTTVKKPRKTTGVRRKIRSGTSAPHSVRITAPVDDTVDVPQTLLECILGEYGLSMKAQITQQFVGEIQGGYRVDLTYTGPDGSVNFAKGTSGLSAATLRRLSVQPALTSGNDWVLLSKAGQVDFDSRITLSFGDGSAANPRCLFGGRIRGRTNLRETQTPDGPLFDTQTPDASILAKWQGGLPAGSWMPLVLAVTFDIPLDGFEPAQKASYDDCRELGRSLFVALGRATFGFGPNSPVDLIELDLVRVQTRQAAGAQRGG
jgi:hypothetical protein